MDSSINTAKPYKEKAPPRRKAPVRRPRVKKDPEPGGFTSNPQIGLVQRLKNDERQAKLIAETEKASATAIQKAIRSNLARKVVKNMKTSTPKVKTPKNEIVAKKPKNEIVAKASTPSPVPATAKPKKERKPRAPKAEKPNYKMSYSAALKAWNASRGNAMYCNPRKGTDDYKDVQALRL
jgi:hypothetical protein